MDAGLIGLVAVATWLGASLLTAIGERRRGRGWLAAGAAAIFFPVAWCVWCVRDGGPGAARR